MVMSSPALRHPKSLWSYNPLPTGCVLYLPVWHPNLGGSLFESIDPYKETVTVVGITQGSYGWLLDGNDYATLPATVTQLDFTTGAFTIIAWIYLDDVGNNLIFIRGLATTDGYYFSCGNPGRIFFSSYGAADRISLSADNTLVVSTWTMAGVTRSGTSVLPYKNGVDVANTAGTHDAIITSARTTKIGIYNDLVTDPFEGRIGEIWVYDRALSPTEMLYMYDRTKWRFQ